MLGEKSIRRLPRVDSRCKHVQQSSKDLSRLHFRRVTLPCQTGTNQRVARVTCTERNVIAPRVRCITVHRGVGYRRLNVRARVAPRFMHRRVTRKQTILPTGVGRPRTRPVVVNHGFLIGVGAGVNGSTAASDVSRRIRGTV